MLKFYDPRFWEKNVFQLILFNKIMFQCRENYIFKAEYSDAFLLLWNCLLVKWRPNFFQFCDTINTEFQTQLLFKTLIVIYFILVVAFIHIISFVLILNDTCTPFSNILWHEMWWIVFTEELSICCCSLIFRIILHHVMSMDVCCIFIFKKSFR